MKHNYTSSCLALGLWLMLTACGESTQFRVTDEIPAEMNSLPETKEEKGLPETEEDKATETPGDGYAGDEPTSSSEEPNVDPTEGATPEAEPTPDADVTPDPEEDTTPDEPAQNNPSTPAAPLFADCEDSPEKKIVAELYELPIDTAQLPDFETLSSLRTVCLSQLNIADRQFSEGFPGVDGLLEWFALDMKFQVNVPRNGIYEFTLAADDGAILWIDDAEIINNDGLHPVQTKTAKIYLTAGAHTFHVAYYQGPRWRIALELFWKVPGTSSRTYIPASVISRMD